MIEKNIRLQPHHARDLLVGRRSDGRRPGYQPPGGGATSLGSGRDVSGGGGGGGGGGHAAQAAAAQHAARQRAAAEAAAAQQAAAQRAMQATIAQAEKAEANRVAQQAAEGKVDVGFQEALKKTEDSRRREEEFLNTGDYDVFADTTIQPGPKVDVKDIRGEVTDPGSVSYDPTYKTPAEIRTLQGTTDYGQFFRQPTVIEKPKSGIMSAIGGGLKKIGKTIFGDNPLDWALNIASFGGYEKAKYAKMLLGLKKEGSISNKAYKKVKSFLDTPKKVAKKLVKDKDRISTQIAKGTGLESGAELLGLKEKDDVTVQAAKDIEPAGQITNEERQKYISQLDYMQGILQSGYYTNRQGETIQLTDDHRRQLSDYMNQLNTYLNPTTQGIAHGGLIDSPLTGRSRYI